MWMELSQKKKVMGMNKCNGNIYVSKQQTKVCPKFFIKWQQLVPILQT
jgi:hypothetical protein